jgi:curved DNA-binding protein CbpA
LSKNYYHILGVPSNASAAQIKAAYKRMALKFHPDKNPHSSQAEERFKQVNEAYQVLSNPRRRALFDLQQQQAQQQRQADAYTNPRYHHTRRPAGFQERHYRQRPQQAAGFTRRDRQIIIGVVLLIGVLVLLVLGLWLGWNQLSAGRALEQAQVAEQEKKWQQAHTAYSQALDFKPSLQEARIKRATLRLVYLNNPAGAVEDYTVLLKETQNAPAHWYAARGKGFLKAKRYQEALNDLNKAIALDSTQPETYLNRGQVYLRLEDNWSAAEADITRYLQEAPGPPAQVTEALLYRAYALFRKQELSKAWQDTEQALRQNPANPKAFYLQAKIRQAQGDKKQGCALLAKAANLGFALAKEELTYQCPS